MAGGLHRRRSPIGWQLDLCPRHRVDAAVILGQLDGGKAAEALAFFVGYDSGKRAALWQPTFREQDECEEFL